MEQWQYTVMAWTTLGVLIAGFYFLSPKSAEKAKTPVAVRRPGDKKATVEDVPRSTAKAVKQAKNAVVEPARTQEKEKKKKRKDATKSNPVTVAPKVVSPVQHVQDDESEDSDNLEWAKRAAMARSGISLKSETGSKVGQRTMKQSTVPGGLNASTPDVSDMLPPPEAAPAVLRMTPSTQPAKPVQAAKEPSPGPETKKQRQNRRKAEERQRANAEAAQEQKQLEEQQRRRAREARGEPAKDGTKFLAEMNANAWSGNTPVVAATAAPEALLDTFDSTHSATDSTENDDGWLQVGKKKAGRKDHDDGSVTPASREAQDLKPSALQVPVPNGVNYQPPALSAGFRHPLDSAWSVE